MIPLNFSAHEADPYIMWKKDGLEVDQWTESLGFIAEELMVLIGLADRYIKDTDIKARLLEKQRGNTFITGELFRYENTMKNALECEDLACDTYYLDNHEQQRVQYLDHLKGYRQLKMELYSKLLRTGKD